LILTSCICLFLDYEGELSDLATDSFSTFSLVSTKHNVFGSQSNRQSGNCIKYPAFWNLGSSKFNFWNLIWPCLSVSLKKT